MLKLKTFFVPIFVLALLASGCQSTGPKGNTASLQGLYGLSGEDYHPTEKAAGMSDIRKMALKEIALSIGARSGLSRRSKQIDAILKRQARSLDFAFNFHALLLDHNILPPVLLEGRNALHLADPNTIRLADRVYQIKEQARFATTVPNWRDYLWQNFPQPKRPDVSLLPRTREEKALWNEYVKMGWQEGDKQANKIFTDNLARLKQTYQGMILYRKLLAQHMVSPPYVARTDLGVTGDGETMRVNDQVLRISALPQLQSNNDGHWRPAIAPGYQHSTDDKWHTPPSSTSVPRAKPKFAYYTTHPYHD